MTNSGITCWFAGEAHLDNSKKFKSTFLRSSQDALSNEHVKQEPYDSPPWESSKAAQLLEGKSRFIENTITLFTCFICSFDHEMILFQSLRNYKSS